MALTTGDILVYDGTQWNNQPSADDLVDLPGPLSIDSPTFYVDTANHRLGLGTTSPLAQFHLATPSDWTDTGGSQRLAYVLPSASPPGDSATNYRGLECELTLKGSGNYTGVCRGASCVGTHAGTGSGAVTFLAGIIGTGQITGTGSITTAYGGWFTVEHENSMATIGTGIAGNFRALTTAGGTITNGVGVRIQTPSVTNGGAISTLYGVQIQNQGVSGVGTSVGLRVDSQAGATTSYAAIFAGGNVGIVQTSPTALLHLGTSGTVGHLRMDGIAGNPASPAAGDHWYNTTQKSHRVQATIGTVGLTGLLYANTSVPGGNTVANTTSETNFTSSFAIPAGGLTVGKSLQINARGTYGTKSSSAGTLTLRFKFGSTTIAATAALSPGDGLSNRGWALNLELTVTAVGGSGNVEAQGVADLATGTAAAIVAEMVNTGTVTVDTTAANTAQLSAQWSTADTGNTITLRLLKIRVDD